VEIVFLILTFKLQSLSRALRHLPQWHTVQGRQVPSRGRWPSAVTKHGRLVYFSNII